MTKVEFLRTGTEIQKTIDSLKIALKKTQDNLTFLSGIDYSKDRVKASANGDFYCYEIKSSVEDFRSKNGHNFVGDYNYYIMEYDAYLKVKNEIPYNVGVYCPNSGKLRSVKRACRKDRQRPVTEMLLMMFRSAARDKEHCYTKRVE